MWDKHIKFTLDTRIMERLAFPGSFDPVTNGHIAILRRLVEKYNDNEIVIAIGENYGKDRPDFTVRERKEMIRKAMSVYPELQRVMVDSYRGSLSSYAYRNMAKVVRGIRNKEDRNYEKELIEALDSQDLDIRSIVLPASKDMAGIRSSLVKAYQRAQMSIEKFVHPYVKQCVEARISGQYIIGVTGSTGVGKSHVCREIERIGIGMGIPVFNTDLDRIPHGMYDGTFKEPIYGEVRKEIGKEFGKEVELPDGKINRKKLGEIVFGNPEKLKRLNEIVYKPMMDRLRTELYDKRGLIIIDAALAAELDMIHLSNNNFILVDSDRATQERRLKERGFTEDQIRRRLGSQYTTELKREIIQREISKYKHGEIWEINNSDGQNLQISSLFDDLIEYIDQYGELRFMGLWNRIGADGTPYKEYSRLLSTYSEPHRYYHSLSHIVDGLGDHVKAKHLMENPDEVQFAWFYHDFVYRDRSKVNEEEGAKVAYSVCKDARLPEDFAVNVKDLILTTRHHGDLPIKRIDEGFIIDMDLAIFGKSPEKFAEYEQGIREEYRWVDHKEFRENRIHILERFLKRPSNHIYCTDFFRQMYERQAKENLERSLSQLKNS